MLIKAKEWIHDSSLYYSLYLGICFPFFINIHLQGNNVLEATKVFIFNPTKKETDVEWIS